MGGLARAPHIEQRMASAAGDRQFVSVADAASAPTIVTSLYLHLHVYWQSYPFLFICFILYVYRCIIFMLFEVFPVSTVYVLFDSPSYPQL